MNVQLMILELLVIALALGVLLIDLWTPTVQKPRLAYLAVAGVAAILFYSLFTVSPETPRYAFEKMFVSDSLALFFKQFFLGATILVLLMSAEFTDRIQSGLGEFFALILFALAGMMFAASANDFILVFVALEFITITFYILTSFQRNKLVSLEAGIKYLILGALSSGFLVFGIALIFGTANTTNFSDLAELSGEISTKPVFLLGLLLALVALGFKIAAFPFQMWAPDVYEGSPAPVTAFLAIGSKAAGFVLLLRVLFVAVPGVSAQWSTLLMAMAGVTILYGNLCAIPQRNLKRLLGYSSISNAGYLLLGVAALSGEGQAALLYYLSGYLFTVVAAFFVICLVSRGNDSEDISILAGLNQRSPLLAATLTLAMVSLAGIPPLAGFFGKFLLLKSVIDQGTANHAYYVLVAVALAGVIISLYYYFGVIRAIYWAPNPADLSPIPISLPTKFSLWLCIAGMLYLGLFPGRLVTRTNEAARVLNSEPARGIAQASAPSR